MAELIEVNDSDFDDKVVQSTTPVLVDFWATWCGPCKMIAPILKQVASETEGVLTIAKLDADANPDVCKRFGVSGLPTLLLFKGGEPVERITGFKPRPHLLRLLSKHVDGLVPA